MLLNRTPSARILVLVAGGVIFLLFLLRLQFGAGDTAWARIASLSSAGAPLTSVSTSSTPESAGITVLEPPADYGVLSEDQQRCEQFYGRSYLTHIASHQQPYCERDSLSHLQCFKAQRLPAPWVSPWHSDPLCLAQGVFYKPYTLPSDDLPDKPFSIRCRPRNFTIEGLASQQVADELKDFPPIDNMGVYWFGTGVGPQIERWEFVPNNMPGPNCAGASSDFPWIILAKREGSSNFWHNVIELWQVTLSFDAIQMAVNPATGKPWITPEEAANVRVVIEDDAVEQVDDWWTIVTGKPPMRLSDLPRGICLPNVILPLAPSASPFWTAIIEKVNHETCRTQYLMDAFVRRVLRFFRIKPRSSTDIHHDPVITVNNRTHNRKFVDIDLAINKLRELYPGSRINLIDFASISDKEQLELIQTTDVYVGHHGAGMTHVMFLSEAAAVVEILPPTFSTVAFRELSRMRGLTYFAAHSMWPEVWNATVNGVPIPDGWEPPPTEDGWQGKEWTYMLVDDFVGVVDAAVRNQKNRLPNKDKEDAT